jgi:hypothetical protein
MSIPYSGEHELDQLDKKLDTSEHHEFAGQNDGKTDRIGEQDLVPVSAFVNLTPGQTIRKFWRLYSAGIATAIGAVWV